jgi:hypothetical protein
MLGAASNFLGGTGFSLCFFAAASSSGRHEACERSASFAPRATTAVKIDLTPDPFPHGKGNHLADYRSYPGNG